MSKISIANQFQRSIRIDLDLDNTDALSGYIPVQSCLNTLHTMARAMVQKHDYAFTWTGAYGCGKSALALMLLSLLSPNAEIKQLAANTLQLNDVGADFKTAFAGYFERICLVGGRKSLRGDLYSALCALTGIKGKNTPENVSTDEIYSLFANLSSAKRVFVAIDELGKYLEYSIKTNDVYFLQELADYASRSEGRVVILGILHQSFDAYVSFLPTKVREEWAKVQGRFENYLIEPSPYESLNLIGGSIVKEDYDSERYATLNHELATYLSTSSPAFKNGIENLLTQCLPLHGITAVLLASLARKNYGQNERTIYSFLNSMEPFSLNDFLEQSKDSSPLYRPSDLYDYLRVNQDININLSKDSHKWAIAKELIERFEHQISPLCLNLLKTIAVIDIFSAVFRLSPTAKLLQLCLDGDSADVEQAMQELQSLNAVIYRNVDAAFHLFIGSDFDFTTELNKELLKTDFDVKVLNGLSFDKDRVIARRHYLETGNLRWMKMCLVQAGELNEHLHMLTPGAENFAEFVLVLYSNESELGDICKSAKKCADKAILGVVPNSEEIIARTREYIAAKALRNHESLEGDEIARREVIMRLQDYETQLRNLVGELTSQAQWFYAGVEQQLNDKQLSVIASELADKVFSKAVPLNNELINRSKISPNVTAARRNLLKLMVTCRDQKDFGITGTPAEFGMYDSVLLDSGICTSDSSGTYIDCRKCTTKAWKTFFKDTDKFIEKRGVLTLDELYEFWRQAPYGLKNGVMPILALAFVISSQDRFAFYDSQFFITEVSSDIVEEILVNSDEFTIKSFRSAENYEAYSINIATALKDVLGIDSELIPLQLARRLVRFVLTLPQLTVNTNLISVKAKKLRALLRKADDPIELLYTDLPEIFPDLDKSADSLALALSELKEHYAKQLQVVKEKFFNAFDERKGLTHLAKRASIAAEHTSNRQVKSLKQLLENYQGDTELFIKRFVVMCSEVSENRWTDAAIEKTVYDLPKLSLDFRQAECFANVSDSSKARRMVALTFASSAKQDTMLVAEISPDDEAYIKEQADMIISKLGGMDRQQAIAIVAEIGQYLAKHGNT